MTSIKPKPFYFLMKSNHQIDRSKVNEQAVSAQDFPKSGFNLTYTNYADYILGRLHPAGYQHIMPADKFSGRNEGNFTFNRIAQNIPDLADIEVGQYNFYCTLRSLDTTFEDNFAPNKNNSMSANWHAPSFSLSDAFNACYKGMLSLNQAFPTVFLGHKGSETITATDLTAWNTLVGYMKKTPNNPYWPTETNAPYMSDYLQDLSDRGEVVLAGITATSTYAQAMYKFLDFFSPLIGENSLLDMLGYIYLRRYDMKYIADNFDFTDETSATFDAALLALFNNTLQNEYALRAYYAVWYEYFRDVQLEPVSSTLPKWKSFGSTSIVNNSTTGVCGWFYLTTRIRSWQKDMFVSSLPDDPMRHVFAPISTSSEYQIYQDNTMRNYLDAEDNFVSGENSFPDQRNIRMYTLEWKDPILGSAQSIQCPLPGNINDSLSFYPTSFTEVHGLDLYTLRQAHMLEQYLKRNFYFGDEYRDRMLAHYGSVVSDMRVNRPQLLSSSLSSISKNQQVANIPTSDGTSNVGNTGDRTVTATASSNGDGYQFFAEEFGIVLNILTFMPRAQYAGVCPQNLLYKQIDYPLPEFATNNDEFSRIMEIAFTGCNLSGYQTYTFGHHPYAHAWRSRVDEVHGSYLSDKQDYTFRRFFGMDVDDRIPKLNYQFIHCRPNLGMFVDTIRLDGQLYGSVKHNFLVERVLPTPVETI